MIFLLKKRRPPSSTRTGPLLPSTTLFRSVIAAVASRSDARAKGLRRGDVILSINRSPVTTAEALAKGVADAKKAGRSAVLLEILRRGQQPAFVAIRVDGK